MIDTHCHLLPGVDDGAGDEQEALQMARLAAAGGITGIVVTPHDLPGLYGLPPGIIRERVAALQQSLQEAGIDLKLYPGSEVALAPDLPLRYARGELLTLADSGRYILVELPLAEIPPYTGDVLYRLQVSGLVPVIAHPERNGGVLQNPAWAGDMVERGMLLQLSAPGITGLFGRQVQGLALELVRRGWVQLVATDAHSAKKRPPDLVGAKRTLENLLLPEALELLFNTNPSRIISGLDMERLEGGGGLHEKPLKRFFGKFFSGKRRNF